MTHDDMNPCFTQFNGHAQLDTFFGLVFHICSTFARWDPVQCGNYITHPEVMHLVGSKWM